MKFLIDKSIRLVKNSSQKSKKKAQFYFQKQYKQQSGMHKKAKKIKKHFISLDFLLYSEQSPKFPGKNIRLKKRDTNSKKVKERADRSKRQRQRSSVGSFQSVRAARPRVGKIKKPKSKSFSKNVEKRQSYSQRSPKSLSKRSSPRRQRHQNFVNKKPYFPPLAKVIINSRIKKKKSSKGYIIDKAIQKAIKSRNL